GTGGSLKTKSDADGHFRVEHLLPGKYRLTVEATGFKTFVREGLELTGGQTARAPVTMEVGAVTERVEVKATAPLIETETPQISAVRPWGVRKFLPTSSPDFYSTAPLDPGPLTGKPAFQALV